ncbi:MAG: ATP synthase F1 subunit delta [Candidatus Gastranaerophilales bacterium]|nr:ATP synthase F1 subunit delta [Candidatus Gastranaerophilales bacterium]
MNSNQIIEFSTIAQRYSDAMFDIAKSTNDFDKMKDDFTLVTSVFKQSNDLKPFLEHPTVENKDKKEVIDKIFKSEISDSILNLLKLLLDKNRFFILPSIINLYEQSLNKMRNISQAQVFTVIEMKDDSKQKLKNNLEKLLNKKIELITKIDKDIIGGVVVKIGDKVIDGSIRGRLNNLAMSLDIEIN